MICIKQMLSMASCDHNFKGLDSFKGDEVLMQSNISLFNHYAVNTDKQPTVTHFRHLKSSLKIFSF